MKMRSYIAEIISLAFLYLKEKPALISREGSTLQFCSKIEIASPTSSRIKGFGVERSLSPKLPEKALIISFIEAISGAVIL